MNADYLEPSERGAATALFIVRTYNGTIRQTQTMANRRYTISDGRLALALTEAPEGGFVVRSPMEPELITEAETIAEAFENARDAIKALRQSRAKLLKTFRSRVREGHDVLGRS